jgi:hypothetical protein
MPPLDKDLPTLAEAKSALRKAVNLANYQARGAILAGEAVDQVKVLTDSLENPVHISSAVIRYYR